LADFLDTDACVIPVLTPAEAGEMSSGNSLPLKPVAQSLELDTLYLRPGEHTVEILQELGLSLEEGIRMEREWALNSGKLKL